MKMTRTALLGCLLAACIGLSAFARVTPETLKQINTPDRVESSNGAPQADTLTTTPAPPPDQPKPGVNGWWGTTAGFGALIGRQWLTDLRSRGWEVIRQDVQHLPVDRIPPIVREIQDAGFRPFLLMTAAQTPYMPPGIDVNMLDAPDPTPGGMEPWYRVSAEAYAAAINAAMPRARARGLRVWAAFVHIGEAQTMAWFRRVFPLLDPDVRISVNRYPPGGATDFDASNLGGREHEMSAFKSIIGTRPWCVSEVGWHQGPLKHWYQRVSGGHYHLTDAQIADLAQQEAAYWRRHGADMMCWYQVQDGPARCRQHPTMPLAWTGGFGLRGPTGWKQVSTVPLMK